MTAPPNPLARLVGELPNLRERLAKATPKEWIVDCDGDVCDEDGIIAEVFNKRKDAYSQLLAASPSAHAIAIEAIERLESVEKALKEIVAEYKAHDTAAIDAIYQIAADALAALAAEPDKQKEK